MQKMKMRDMKISIKGFTNLLRSTNKDEDIETSIERGQTLIGVKGDR